MSIQRNQLWGALAGALLAVSVPAALAGEIYAVRAEGLSRR